MGCDIHTFREKKINGTWLSDDEWERESYEGTESFYVDYYKAITRERNYNYFGLIANVRRGYNNSFEPKGLPNGVSDMVQKQSDHWGEDGHSHSQLDLEDVKVLITRAMTDVDIAEDAKYIIPSLQKLKAYLEDLPEGVEEKRVVFWFDN